ncbi:MAG: hypothetical protein WBA44_12090 [Mesorhizobium sp.]
MTGLYGPYDKKLKCWIGKFDGDRICMRPHKLVSQSIDGAERVYMVIAGAQTPAQECHACGGNVGFVVLEKRGDRLELVAANDLYHETGSWGRAPDEEAFNFVRLGPKEYGWTMDFGYTGQGVTMGSVEVFAPVDAQVKSLGGIMTIFDDCAAYGDGRPCDSYSFDLSFDETGQGRYYDAVLTLAADSEKPDIGDRFVVPFVADKGEYVAPSEVRQLLRDSDDDGDE